ncbi:MAG: DUF885 domain-containing protein [Elusimicrobia bacterium]|nr:DUF885 domain-containing protein [Elusimicrobiota bacterium]
MAVVDLVYLDCLMEVIVVQRLFKGMSAFLLSILLVNNIFAYEDSLTVQETDGKLEGARLDELTEKYLATISMYDPERATEMGMHDNDNLLTDREYNTQAKELESLKLLYRAVNNMPREVLDYEKQTDYDLVSSIIEKDIYEIENLNVFSTQPQYYLKPFDLIYFMMSKDYENYNVRAQNAIKRFSQVPSVLYQAERNITRPPKIWTEYTIKRINLLIDNFGDYYPLFRNYIGLDATTRANFEKSMSDLKNALIRYRDYLKRDVLKKSDGKAYTGLYTYGFYLERWHKIDYNPRKALRIAKKNFEKNYKLLKENAIKLNPDEYSKNGVKGVYDKITGDYPEYDNVIKYISDQIENAKNHFDEYKVVKFPTQRLLINSSPMFFLTVYPTIFYYPSFPLDKNRASELYIFLPQEKDIGDSKKFLSQLYSQPKIEFFVSGLVIPGSHLREDYLNSVSKIRRIADQSAIKLGWMMYSEDISEEMGYYSSVYTPFLLSYVRALRSLRAYVDVGYHIEELDYDESVKLFKDNFQMDDTMAKDEVLNISLNPTYYYAGMYGYTSILELREKYVGEENKFFDMREFHSDLLSRGNIPIENLKKELKEIRKERLKEKILEEDEE